MSTVKIQNFVDVNIIRKNRAVKSGTRDTVILFTNEANLDVSENPITEIIEINSLVEAKEKLTGVMPNALKYCTVYFNNGGKKLLLYTNINSNEIDLSEIANEYICIAYASDVTTQATDAQNLLALAHEMEAKTGIEQKIILTRTTSTTAIQTTITYDAGTANETTITVNSAETKNFVLKYASNTNLGAEMTIAAYLSKINVYGTNSIFDYMFTIEDANNEEITDAQYKSIINNNINVDFTLANEVRNCGGNCSNGDDLVNTYVLIVLQQTLTDAVVELLATKLKNQSGINKLYPTITAELEKYKSSGYLTTDKIWTYDDLYYTWHDKQYLIIEQGTAIQNGYYIKILPYADLDDTDKQNRKAPPIYVIIAEQYGIRSIQIDGEAF